MQSFVQKPAQPITVQAMQYVAPTADQPGNADEIAASGVPFQSQQPWNPTGGQSALRVEVADSTKLLTDGDILVAYPGGGFDVMSAADFKAAFDPAS